MKYLIACVTLALFAYINASPAYGNRGGYGGGYGGYGGVQRVVYEEVPAYGPAYGPARGYGSYPRSLKSEGNGGRASAAAAAAAASVKPGTYGQYVIPSYELDGARGYEIGNSYGPRAY
ncbi:chorion protein S15 [Drosophila santomea]|uniref:chorion protein S15 n=1 Tax=Drosophila santomea TaxID=129105 RepID=UPI0019538459|nr:chorion protein S15 [Drosophila santomea]